MSVSQIEKNGLPYVRLVHPSKLSSAEVCLFGATVTSFTTQLPGAAAPIENLFVSKKAVLDGSKAIRGGVPLVFPQFGPGGLPNHGFARTSTWRNVAGDVHPDGTSVRAVFQLEQNEETLSIWPFKFMLTYTVTLQANSLTCALDVHNTSDAPMPFQALLHTYFAIDDITKVSVHGLKGLEYADKVAQKSAVNEEDDVVAFSMEVDRVYAASPNTTMLRGIRPGCGVVVNKSLTSIASASAEPKALPCDIVIWNPWIEKTQSTGDLDDEEYKVFFCAEPGVVSVPCATSLAPGEHTVLEQNIRPFTEASEATAAE